MSTTPIKTKGGSDPSTPDQIDERTPLIPSTPATSSYNGIFNPVRRVLFTVLLLSLTFASTQTSLLYAFRVMTCDEYYKTHQWTGTLDVDAFAEHGKGDRCAVPRIEADTAGNIALMSTTTTGCTIANLFVTGWFIKRYGPKAAMFQQTFWAALRNLCQIYALSVGSINGIRIIQITQFFNVLGSAGGYQIASNVYIATLVPAEQRTSMFGVLTGVIMGGSSVGYTVGGLLYNYFGLLAPWHAAFSMLCFCTLFGAFFLPYVAPETHSTSDPSKEKKKSSFLAPLKIFIPKRVQIEGTTRTKYDFNLLLLASGAFFSVLATGYVNTGLQLVGTDAFGFQPGESGLMLSLNLLVKAFFLSICFPRIITFGRRLISHQSDVPTTAAEEEQPYDPVQAEEPDAAGEPRQDQARQPTDIKHGSHFDLIFLQWSIFTDGLLTGLTTLSTKGWHLYVAAVVLPFASATGSACKGVTLDFVEPDQRADALSAIALVEKLAQVSTISLFSVAFSMLSEIGKPTMVFLLNGSVAMISFVLLLFVRLPTPRKEQGRLAL